MKIRDERIKYDSCFKGINVGDVFEHGRDIYIKTNFNGINAVSLSTGKVAFILDDEPVNEILATLLIEDWGE